MAFIFVSRGLEQILLTDLTNLARTLMLRIGMPAYIMLWAFIRKYPYLILVLFPAGKSPGAGSAGAIASVRGFVRERRGRKQGEGKISGLSYFSGGGPCLRQAGETGGFHREGELSGAPDFRGRQCGHDQVRGFLRLWPCVCHMNLLSITVSIKCVLMHFIQCCV